MRFVHNLRLQVTFLTKILKLNTQQIASPMDMVGVSYILASTVGCQTLGVIHQHHCRSVSMHNLSSCIYLICVCGNWTQTSNTYIQLCVNVLVVDSVYYCLTCKLGLFHFVSYYYIPGLVILLEYSVFVWFCLDFYSLINQ